MNTCLHLFSAATYHQWVESRANRGKCSLLNAFFSCIEFNRSNQQAKYSIV